MKCLPHLFFAHPYPLDEIQLQGSSLTQVKKIDDKKFSTNESSQDKFQTPQITSEFDTN